MSARACQPHHLDEVGSSSQPDRHAVGSALPTPSRWWGQRRQPGSETCTKAPDPFVHGGGWAGAQEVWAFARASNATPANWSAARGGLAGGRTQGIERRQAARFGSTQQTGAHVRAHVAFHERARIEEIPHDALAFFLTHTSHFFGQAVRDFGKDGSHTLKRDLAFWARPVLEVFLAGVDGDASLLKLFDGHGMVLDFRHRRHLLTWSFA